MRVFNWVWIFSTLALTVFLGRGTASVPAFSRLLEIHNGIWRHSEFVLHSMALPGLKSRVQVAVDANGIPHIFAENERDLYRVQGYVMASQRLFQMDLSTRVAPGRLSEWVGDKTRELDRFFVRFGMRDSIGETMKRYQNDSKTVAMIDAFVDGVNAYIDRLRDLPPEYKIIGQSPEHFDRERVINMDKTLTFDLSSRAMDLVLTRLAGRMGVEKVLDLFPERYPVELQDYVAPGFGSGKERSAESAELFKGFKTQLEELPFFPLQPHGKGSNNWAVSPRKSKTGFSMMANDTHLNFSLPNIWHEVQLVTPQFNVYGVSLIAIPGIINGFNHKIAWGPTNGTTDALDFYEIEFENETSWRYRLNGGWREAETHDEKIVLKNGDVDVVQVVKTHLGYLMHREGRLGLVANWMGHRTDNELEALRGLYEARDERECLDSFRSWAAPIQNFICIDQKNIAIQHTGAIPKRRVGEGRFVMDGRNIELTPMDERIPEKLQPRAENPPSGFVLSANQRVVDSRYPYFLGWDYEEPFRGMGIRRDLLAKDKLSPEDMMAIQNDDFDMEAAMVLPIFLKHLNTSSLPENAQRIVALLKAWDFRARAETIEPAVYHEWFTQFRRELFADSLKVGDVEALPQNQRVVWLLERLDKNSKDSDAQWLELASPKRSSFDDAVSGAFSAALKRLTETYGKDSARWYWRLKNEVTIPHVAKLKGFGTPILSVDGARTSVRGVSHRHGPVYKIVVAMGDKKPDAWIQVPGGNEGDPFARGYGRFIDEWAKGEMRKVNFYESSAEAKADAKQWIEFSPEAQ